MKKIYIEPKMTSHKIKMNTILCGSEQFNMNVSNESATEDAGSRSFSFSDEE